MGFPDNIVFLTTIGFTPNMIAETEIKLVLVSQQLFKYIVKVQRNVALRKAIDLLGGLGVDMFGAPFIEIPESELKYILTSVVTSFSESEYYADNLVNLVCNEGLLTTLTAYLRSKLVLRFKDWHVKYSLVADASAKLRYSNSSQVVDLNLNDRKPGLRLQDRLAFTNLIRGVITQHTQIEYADKKRKSSNV